jgi:hypothetical protein
MNSNVPTRTGLMRVSATPSMNVAVELDETGSPRAVRFCCAIVMGAELEGVVRPGAVRPQGGCLWVRTALRPAV